MKTKENSIKKSWSRGIDFFLALAVVIAGCTSIDAPIGTDDNGVKSFEDLNINVKYAESYDQTTVTFSRHWPNSISTSLAKNVEGGGELMIDYERVHEVIAFDEDGYMSRIKEFLEGDSRMNMPESVYNRLKDTMPSRSANDDPIIREEMSDGEVKLITKSGKLREKYTYDPELYRVSETELQDYIEWQSQEVGDSSYSTRIGQLEREGIKYELEGDHFVKYSLSSGNELIEELRLEYLDDLRTGLPVRLVTFKKDGSLESVQFNQYNRVNNMPILSQQVTYQYGDVNGEWDVAYKTQMTRENIQVIRN